jgi:hypothetical protein
MTTLDKNPPPPRRKRGPQPVRPELVPLRPDLPGLPGGKSKAPGRPQPREPKAGSRRR